MGRRRSKGRKRSPSSGRSRLEDHRKVGKILQPPLRQLPTEIATVAWLRDVLPDMLWLLSLCRISGVAGVAAATDVLAIINHVVGRQSDESSFHWVVDGRLTTIESVPVSARDEIAAQLFESELSASAFPDSFLNAMALFPEMPGRWLMPMPASIDRGAAEAFLSEVVTASLHGADEVPTMAKVIAGRARMATGQVEVPNTPKFAIFKLLPRWPDGLEADQRKGLEALMRAGFMTGCLPLDQEGWVPVLEWARDFWQSNWDLFDCRVLKADDGAEAESPAEVRSDLVKAWGELFERFASAADVDPNLYDPDRHEVLAGIAARALRLIRLLAGDPLLWSGEFGGSLARAIVEALVVMRWLLKQERADSAIYRAFKDHGRGKLKLYKLHLEREIEKAGSDAPEAVVRQLHQLQDEVESESAEELQQIDLSSRFSNTDLRAMARAVGMDREYNTMLAPASATTHGEWPSLARYSLTTCLHPLHRGHRLVRLDRGPAYGPGLPLNALGMGEMIVETFEGAMQPETADDKGES